MAFSRYSRDPLGGYNFVDDVTGQETHLYGPEADALASQLPEVADLERRIDETAYQGAVASNDPMAGMGGAGGGPPQQTGIPPRFKPAGVRPDVTPAVPQRDIGEYWTRQWEARLPPEKKPGDTQGQATEQAPLMPRPQPRQQPMVTLPGSPGRNPARERDTGMMVPRGGTTSTTKGIPYSDEDAAARADADINEQLARQSQAERDRDLYREQSARLQEEAQAREANAAEQRAILATAKQRVDQQWAEVQQAREDHEAKRVDPQRLFKESGAWAGIVAAISAGLGAYSAGRGGGPNYAQQAIDRIIDRDIAAQEAAIDQSQGRVNNALAMYDRALGDRDAAKEMLRAIQHSVADAERDSWAASMKSEQAMSNFAAWKAEQDKANLERERILKERSLDREVQNVTTEFAIPRAGSAARRVPLSALPLAQQAKYKKALLENRELDQQLSGEGGDRLPEKLEGDVRTYGAELEAVDAAKRELQNIAADIGMVLNDDGTSRTKEDAEDVPGVGMTGSLPNSMVSRKAVDVRGKLDSLAATIAKANEGGGNPSEGATERAKASISGASNDDELRDVISGLWQTNREQEAVRRGKWPDEVERAYERRKARKLQSQRERSNRPGVRELR